MPPVLVTSFDQGPGWHNPSFTRHFCDFETLAVRSSEGRGSLPELLPEASHLCETAFVGWQESDVDGVPDGTCGLGDDPEGVRRVTIGRQKAIKDLVRYHD